MRKDVAGMLKEGMPSTPATTVKVFAGFMTSTSTVPAGWIVGRVPIVCALVAVLITT